MLKSCNESLLPNIVYAFSISNDYSILEKNANCVLGFIWFSVTIILRMGFI